MLEAALPLLPPQITHLGATVSPDNSYSLHNAQAGGFVIRCRREMYGGYDRYLLEKQLSLPAVFMYNLIEMCYTIRYE